MNDRDHFAAAALTGLLSNIPRYQLEPLTRQAWEIADFMLRKREQTHGGCPSGLDPEADRKSVASQRCRDTGGQPSESAPTTLDAAPAAKATEPESSVPLGSGVAPANTQEPVAWAVYTSDGQPYDVFFSDPACDVERMRGEWMAISGATFVPLYRTQQTCPYVVGRTTQHCSLTPFTLTDEEREAIAYYVGTGGPDMVDATLRSLLERLG